MKKGKLSAISILLALITTWMAVPQIVDTEEEKVCNFSEWSQEPLEEKRDWPFADDDVGVTASGGCCASAPGGSVRDVDENTIIWEYTYNDAYLVATSTDVDILKLHIERSITSDYTVTDLKIELFESKCCKGNAIATWVKPNKVWERDGISLGEQADVFGCLENKCVASFRLTIKFKQGWACVKKIEFLWEAWSIEICPYELAVCGGDPPIYRNIMVFPTPEHFLGSDLNGDNDTNDVVLRYQNLKTNRVVNTGLIGSGAYHAIDIYKNVIAFVGEDSHICYYDINTGIVKRTRATGSHPSIYGNIIAFSSKGRIHYFNLSTQALVDTEVPGYSPVIYQNVIVFHAPTPNHAIWVYNLCTGELVNTGAIGKNPTICENIIAFETLEFSIAEDLNGDGDTYDLVIRSYDLETQTITNTGAVGFYPAIFGSWIVFATRECDINQDLNRDDRILGEIIRYYDLETGHLVNTCKLGTQPSIYGNTITFYLWERWADQDLNGDRDQSDPIVGTYPIAVAMIAVADPYAWPFSAFVVI